jgi:Ion channel
MLRTWHHFALQAIHISGSPPAFLKDALRYEEEGNWYGAGERYLQLSSILGDGSDAVTRALVMARAGCAFETSGQLRPAAAAYADSARILEQIQNMPAVAAELFNRAAVAYSSVEEYFVAAMNWRACASAFAKVEANVINCSESWGPLPNSSFKSHLVGLCFEVSANAAEKARGQEVWSVGAYWEAGKAYGSGIPNIQTFNAYRNALRASIRHYGTLSIERLRNILPITSAERAEQLDPLHVMERALLWCNQHHQAKPGPSQTASLQTWRELMATYHGFSAEFIGIANLAEAGEYRLKEHELRRRIFLVEKEYFKAAGYWIWKTTASYGESLTRWSFSCIAVLLLFGILFYLTNSIGPVRHVFDYLYFSTITFSTLGYGDIHPTTTTGQILSCLEVACGFIMFGILLTLVGTRLKEL